MDDDPGVRGGIALIGHARQRDPAAAPFLIVAPASVVANWAAEAARFTAYAEGGTGQPFGADRDSGR